jgi:general secretion pathway protein G
MGGGAGEQRGGEAGFTLVELLVVMAILGLLAALATPQVLKYLGRAKTDAARIEMKNISVGLDLFLIDVGRYPTEQEGLAALVQPPSAVDAWNGPYLKRAGAPVDPWGRPYVYHRPGRNGADYDLYTTGDQEGAAASGTSGPRDGAAREPRG